MQRVRLGGMGYDGKIVINIAAGSGEYTKALDAVFVPDLESLVPSLPFFWQRYAQAHFLLSTASAGSSSPETPKAAAGLSKIAADVKPPRLKAMAEPEFSAAARILRYAGPVEVHLIVNEDGSVGHVQVVKPAGAGLDEAALEAISRYKFAPATQKRQPVQVDMYVDVNFDLRNSRL